MNPRPITAEVPTSNACEAVLLDANRNIYAVLTATPEVREEILAAINKVEVKA